MKWNRLKNRIRSKPELIDPYRVMSYRAAKKTWKIQGRPNTWDFMEGARIKAAKTPSEWEALTGISRKQYVSSANASRRLAIALIVIILMASFMACTVPGRALAKAIYETFTTFVGNMLYISTQEDMHERMPVPEKNSSDTILQNPTLEEAYLEINQPLLYLDGTQYIQEELVVESTVQGWSVSTNYTLGEINICMIQKWYSEGHPLDTDLYLDNAEYYTTSISTDIHLYGTYTDHEHCYNGSTLIGSSVIYIGIMNIYEQKSINSILNDLALYSQ